MRRLSTVCGLALSTFALTAGVAAAGPSGNVAALQVALRAHGLYAGTVDGLAGPATSAAVRELQRRNGLVADGVAGAATRHALGARGRPRWGSRPLHAGLRGWDVAYLQFELARHGFPSRAMNGRLGAPVDAALRRFQAWAGLGADGIAGPGTMAALRKPPPVSPLRLAPPVSAPLGDRFGPRGAWMHTGVDFPVGSGTPVLAAGPGCVLQTTVDPGGYGRLVVLRHALDVTTWYGHLSRITVRPGACFAAGTRVGLSGSTGRSTGPHLHFEVRVRGAAVDPLSAFG